MTGVTWDGHAIEDRDAPCPKCGYQRRALPEWAREPGALFVYGGVLYYVESSPTWTRSRWRCKPWPSMGASAAGRVDRGSASSST